MCENLKPLKKLLTVLFSSILLFTGCENFSFGEDLCEQLDEDLSVTYSFYEDFNFASVPEDLKFMTGKTITPSQFPIFTREQELLVGWKYLGNQVPSNVHINSNEYVSSVKVGLKAESFFGDWREKRYVTFVTNNDIVIPVAVVADGYCVSPPSMEEKHGRFRFNGWYIDSEFNELYDFEQPVTEDITLYAKWTEFNTIRYHKNDGSNDDWAWEYDIDQTVWIQDYNFELRNGYGFVGWSTTSNGNVELYPGNQINDLTHDLDLYAVWTTDLITITYIDTSAKFTKRSVQFGKGAHVRIGKVISDNGYYYDNLENQWKITGKEIKGFSKIQNDDVDNLPYDISGYHQEPQYDSNNNPVLDEYGYQQTEWTSYTKVTTDLTFYVYWGDKLYRLYFYYYDNSGESRWFETQEVKWNEKAVCPANNPYKPGYNFVGWYRSRWDEMSQQEVLYDTPFDFDTIFNEDTIQNAWGIDLYAKFEPVGATELTTIEIEIDVTSDSDIEVDWSYTGDTITFNASTGYDSYEWYFDGVKQSSSSTNIFELTIPSKSGTYEISLIVKKDGNYYSWSALIGL